MEEVLKIEAKYCYERQGEFVDDDLGFMTHFTTRKYSKNCNLTSCSSVPLIEHIQMYVCDNVFISVFGSKVECVKTIQNFTYYRLPQLTSTESAKETSIKN